MSKYIIKIHILIVVYCIIPLVYGYATESPSYDSLLKKISRTENPKELIKCYNELSILYFQKGLNYQAREYSMKALEIARSNNFKKDIPIIYSNLTIMYIKLGDYEKANEYNFLALRIFKEQGNTLQGARCLLSIGSVYVMLKEYNKALEYLQKAKDGFQKVGNKKGYSICLTNIGSIYSSMDEDKKALPYFFEALLLDEQNKDRDGTANNFLNIGKIYFKLGNFQKANYYYSRALDIYNSSEDKSGIASIYLCFSKLKSAEHDMKSAFEYCNKSINLFDETGEINDKRLALEHLSDLYQKSGNVKKAFMAFKEASTLKDSLFNLEKIAKISIYEEKYLSERLAKENLSLKYRNDLQRTKIASQRKLGLTFLIAFVLSIIAISIIVIELRKKNIAYRFIVKKNLDLMNQEEQMRKMEKKMEVLMMEQKPAASFSEDEKERVLNKMYKLLKTDKIYTRPDLTIEKLARRLSTNRTYLSQIINEVYQKNYSDFINEYRIKEAMVSLSNPEKSGKFSIDAIAREAGFNTISTFNTTFKKYTGITPSVFRKNAENQCVESENNPFDFTNS
ncbi:MAG: tetratricopeptide repeat protein [Bacteroidota bacterium]|nr:tetratricopeptide repeat protein [Bacteroidota bacterium]